MAAVVSAQALQDATRARDLHRVTTEEALFSSEYNVPPGHAAGPNDSVRWTLRGYLPPKHLRIPGYDYGVTEDSETNYRFFQDEAPSVVARESIAELMAGCFVPGGAGEETAEQGKRGERLPILVLFFVLVADDCAPERDKSEGVFTAALRLPRFFCRLHRQLFLLVTF